MCLSIYSPPSRWVETLLFVDENPGYEKHRRLFLEDLATNPVLEREVLALYEQAKRTKLEQQYEQPAVEPDRAVPAREQVPVNA